MTRAVLLYIGYMLIALYAFFMLAGTVGFLSCSIFVRLIYGAVKVKAAVN